MFRKKCKTTHLSYSPFLRELLEDVLEQNEGFAKKEEDKDLRTRGATTNVMWGSYNVNYARGLENICLNTQGKILMCTWQC